MISIPAMMMRGGTSKGVYFLKSDLDRINLPWDELLPLVMGSPAPRQIDGVGGGSSTTSKVAIVSPSGRDDCDIDYLFAQVHTDAMSVDWSPTCGNLLIGVGPFAIERGLVEPTTSLTQVRVNLVNTGAKVTVTACTPDGAVTYEGNCEIDGVPGHSAPIDLAFTEFVGGRTGSLFPTGNPVDVVDGVEVTAIDASVCAIIARATDFGITGKEEPADLNEDRTLLTRIEKVRQCAALRMGLGDVRGRVLPKVMLVSTVGGSILRSRYFVPDSCHPAHAVSGAVCLASAAAIAGTVPAALVPEHTRTELSVEHPAGLIGVEIRLRAGLPELASIRRTARKLFDGNVFVGATAAAS